MKNVLEQKPLIVKKSPVHGYGVFAGVDILPNEIIEECYTLKTALDDSALDCYFFAAKELNGLPLGFGCIYNHSEQNNANFYYDEDTNLMVFYALTFIGKDEEILVSYGKYWFSSRRLKSKKLSFVQRSWRYLKGFPLRALLVSSMLCSIIYFLGYMTRMV